MPRKPEIFCDLTVKVTPRSSRNKVELTGSVLNVWTTAPPTDGQANAAVCELIAKAVGVSKSCVLVVSGDTSRKKRVRVEGLFLEDVLGRLSAGS